MRRDTVRRTVATAIVVVVLLATPLGGATAVAADDPPEPPAAYYGQVLVDGDPAPGDVTVSARVNGTVADSIETAGDGTFGGAGAFDEKLKVQAEPGATVTFWVNGEPTETTVEWESGANREVEVGVDELPSSEEGDDGGGSDGDDAAGGGGGGGGAGPTLPVAVSRRSANIDPATSTLEISMPSGSTFSTFRIEFQDGTDGRVTVSELASIPEFTGPPNGDSVVAVANVEVPRSAADRSATVEATIRRSALTGSNVDPSALRIERYDGETGDWETLDTSVVESNGDVVVIAAETPGFSVFSVSVDRSQGTVTAAPTTAATPAATAGSPTPASIQEPTTAQPAANEVPEDTPVERSGFGLQTGLLALLLLGSVLIASYVLYRN